METIGSNFVPPTGHGYFVNVIVARIPKEGLVQVRGDFPEAHLTLSKKAPVVREANATVYAQPVAKLVLGVIGPGGPDHPYE